MAMGQLGDGSWGATWIGRPWCAEKQTRFGLWSSPGLTTWRLAMDYAPSSFFLVRRLVLSGLHFLPRPGVEEIEVVEV
jgi:hypothetical protein